MTDLVPAKSTKSSAAQRNAEHRAWIGGAITTLLGFYFDPRQDESVLEAGLAMWMDDLGGFPRGVIERAIGDWRRNETRRPTPADMIRLCARHMPRPQAVPQIEHRNDPPSDDEKARIAALTGRLFPELKRIPREKEVNA